jgi:RNA polymerase sigma-70 factor (ECF subfamily)
MPSKRQRKEVSTEALEGLTDGDLVDLVQQGNQDAYACLFQRYHRKVFSLAFSRLRNQQDAQDVVQDAFIKVYRYIGSFKGNSSFYTWLYRITANLCIDRQRQASRDQRVELVEGKKLRAAVERGGEMIGHGSVDGDNPIKKADRKEVMVKLEEAILELPDYHRDVILMREIGGMSYNEMAEAMKVSKGTIMSRLFHARRKVKERLQPYLEGEQDEPSEGHKEAAETER